MASYPTSVFAPASKNSGDVIQAAHVNDLQAEVTAIEGGLLNGTAPLNSSNSTVASLSVSNGAVFSNSTTIAIAIGNTNDLAVSAGAFVLLFNGAGVSTITGISAGQVTGRLVMAINISNSSVVLSNNDAASLAANRFGLGANVSLNAGKGVFLTYQGSFWRGTTP